MATPTILVIDDDDDILQVLKTILTEAGYVVNVGRDVTAIYEIEKRPPGLLLIDNWLDGKSGHDICYQLKTDPRTSGIPVILISAIPKLAETARRCLANDYICKPFDVEDLLIKVGNYAPIV